jgi:hypothetical protein
MMHSQVLYVLALLKDRSLVLGASQVWLAELLSMERTHQSLKK